MEHQAERRGRGEYLAQNKRNPPTSIRYNEHRSRVDRNFVPHFLLFFWLDVGKMVGNDWVYGAWATLGVCLCRDTYTVLHHESRLVSNDDGGH